MIVPFSSFSSLISFLALSMTHYHGRLGSRGLFGAFQVSSWAHLCILLSEDAPATPLSTCHGKSNLSSPCGVWAEHAQVTEDGANWRP